MVCDVALNGDVLLVTVELLTQLHHPDQFLPLLVHLLLLLQVVHQQRPPHQLLVPRHVAHRDVTDARSDVIVGLKFRSGARL